MKNNHKNIWLDGVMGVIIGDALGCPVQFLKREELKKRGPVTGMEGWGTYHMPPGTWTDDGSMTLAALDSIRERGMIDLDDIMTRFTAWYGQGRYTPFGKAFDMGNTCSAAIENYELEKDVRICGRTSAWANGNGSLMRILPVCLYVYEKGMSLPEAVKAVHEVSGLTHNHLRSRIGCGLYYFCVRAVLESGGSLAERLHTGMAAGFSFYEDDIGSLAELSRYGRLRDLSSFADTDERGIRSTGYVVDTLEAAVWSLLNTGSFKDALLKAVNLGYDTDSVGAVCGGLAGVYYGYENMPREWLETIQRREWIEEMCRISEETT